MKLSIRPASRRDLAAIVKIYNESALGPKAWFSARGGKKMPLWVAVARGRVVGWLSFQFFGRAARDRVAQASIFVSGAARGKGVGSALLKHALRAAPELAIKSVLAFVFERNRASLGLFKKFRFSRRGGERGLLTLGRTIGSRRSA